MEGQPMVSYFAGSMNSLVSKLTELEHCPNIRNLTQDLLNLEKGFLHKVPERKEMNLQVQAWMKIVRELVFDIEDWIDQMPDRWDQQLEIEEDVKNFKARIEHAVELCERYDLVIEVPSDLDAAAFVPGQVTADSRILFEENTGLIRDEAEVFISTYELVKQMTRKDEKMLKVVTIIGMEGLGKTTLAKKIYEMIEGKFECRAVVTVGRRPLPMRAILKEILRQVKQTPSSHKEKVQLKTNNPRVKRRKATDLQEVITELWEFLCMKRYFILVDGLWSTRAWKIISCALPNKNSGSRVLTTTCINDVARCCSVRPTDVYRMETLSETKSVVLYNRTAPQEQQHQLDRCPEVKPNMLKMCGGMPLAIIITAGMFGLNYEELAKSAKMVRESNNLSSPEQYSTSKGMMEILHMSYATLSLPMKSCFMYLSVFREDYTIMKDRLIRLWLAEGFIPVHDKDRRGEEDTRDEKTLWEKGEMYFNELITRRLIQPVFNYDDDQAVGCTIHSVILEFIKSLSSKGNFVTASGAHMSTDRVRRFSLDCYSNQDEGKDGKLASIAEHLSRVRSITILGDIEGTTGHSALTVSGKNKGTPILSSFKFVRVLDLEDTDHLRSRQLQGIGGLVLLRHLGVAGTAIDELPEEIGELEKLETLNLRQTTKLRTLPVSIAKQKRLVHLLIDGTIKLPREILEMQGMEEVSTIGVDSSRRSINSVVEFMRKSEKLRVIGIRLDGSQLSGDMSIRTFLGHARGLFEQVARCTKLRILSLDCLRGDLLGLLLEFPPPYQLRRFHLTISGPILGGTAHRMASLVSVMHLDIEIVQLDDRVLCVLGELPNLVLLKLVSSGVICSQPKKNLDGRFKVGMNLGFKCLKVFSFKCRYGGMQLQFTAGAMKELRRLSLGFSVRETLSLYGDFSFGIEHLSSHLTRFHATINCKSATDSEVNNAKDATKEQVGSIVPMTEFTTINQHMMLPDQKAKTTTFPANLVKGCIINFRKIAKHPKKSGLSQS